MQHVAEDISDEHLIGAVADGDRVALEQLYDRHVSIVYGLAKRMLRDDGRCEEVVQDVFLTVWQRAAAFDSARAGVRTWIVAMARNRVIDQLRRERSRPPRHGVALDAEVAEVVLADERVDADPVRAAGAHEQAHKIRAALAQLPDAQRRAIELAYFGGYSQSEIAEHLDEPLGTIKTRVFHGMRTLRALLEEAGVRDV